MKDITHKPDTLRSARATATLTLPAEVSERIKAGEIEKGDPIEAAKSAAYLAAKKTWDLLPLCHQLPIQNIDVDIDVAETSIRIETCVEVVAGTGVEMEALTAASIAALTLYDMLKPYAGTDLSIGDIRLLKKTGGKSHYRRRITPNVEGMLILAADSRHDAERRQNTLDSVQSYLADAGIDTPAPTVLEDAADELSATVKSALQAEPALIVVLGGTGIGSRDKTIEVVEPLIETPMPGIMEAARSHGQRRTPFAMISRSIAGLTDKTLVITLPGSKNGAIESLDAIIAGLVHTLEVVRHGGK